MSDEPAHPTSRRPRVLIARRVPEAVAARAKNEFEAVLAEHDMDPADVIAATREHGAQAIFIGPKARLTAADIAELPASVRMIANSSVGYDHMDVVAARARGLIVTNTPDVLTDCTADLAFMLILAACRRAAEYESTMRAGWRKPYGMPDLLGLRASGRVLGIVGMGRIGLAVAKRARGFDMPVLYHNRHRVPAELEQGATYVADFAALLGNCDILSLHLPGGAEVGTLMTRQRFALMRHGSVFVNTARGSLVDEDALIDALQSGQLFAAGLDVFRKEPEFDLRIAELPNVFPTPHMGSATTETRNQMGFKALDNIAAVLAGKPPIDPV
jgi:lactate dehydrogenase-like 2-hydroxyacid dehydrogenase